MAEILLHPSWNCLTAANERKFRARKVMRMGPERHPRDSRPEDRIDPARHRQVPAWDGRFTLRPGSLVTSSAGLSHSDLLQLQHTVGNLAVAELVHRRGTTDGADARRRQVPPRPLVIQREITVANEQHATDDENILNPTLERVRGQLTTWETRSTSRKVKLPKPLVSWLKRLSKDQGLKKTEWTTLKDEVQRLFRETYDGKEYVDLEDLGRQAEQDIMLWLLELPELQGLPQQLDQFLRIGGAGKTKPPFRIYRTEHVSRWKEYQKGDDIETLCIGHGGSLGQALNYFRKSKNEGLNDVLLEFSFEGRSEQNIMDYEEIGLGAEGKGSKGGKMGGKSEKNDVFAPLNDVFSISLNKNKDLIKKAAPTVRAIEYAVEQN